MTDSLESKNLWFLFFHPLLRAAYQQLVRDKKIRLPRFSFAFWRFSKQPWDFFSHWGHLHLTNPTRTLMKCFVKPLSLTLDFICFLLLKDRVVGAGGILAALFVDTNERSPLGHLIREIWRMRVGTTKLILLSYSLCACVLQVFFIYFMECVALAYTPQRRIS